MRLCKPLVTVLSLTACLLSCGGGDAPEVPAAGNEPPSPIDRADAAAQALGQRLMQRLMAETDSGGPAQALTVCGDVAQEIADEHSRDGMTVRRVSLRVRNSADAPDDYETRKLLDFEELDARGELPEFTAEIVPGDAGDTLRYLRPIRIMPLCLQCHGPAEQLDPEIAGLLAELYPDDQATGYAVGDLRGAISVTLPLGEKEP